MSKKRPYARKRFGQHFLCDQSVIEKTIAAADIKPGDHIIEIGPGRGALTGELLVKGADITVVEIDRDLAGDLKKRFQHQGNFRLITQDILKSDWHGIIQEGRCNKVVANLPYNISTPLFFQLVEQRRQIHSMTIMVQKEVAERIGHQGDGKKLKDYGVLSVIAGSVFTTSMLFKVPPGAFNPKPKVDSAVIQLKPLVNTLENEKAFFDFVRRAFNLRRKLLINHLKNNESQVYQSLTDEDQQALQNLRPENLSPQQYQNLFYLGRLGQ